MSIRFQALILIGLILISLTLTQLGDGTSFAEGNNETPRNTTTTRNTPDSLSYQQASLSKINTVKKVPTRKWDVLDPEVSAESVLVHSLDDDLPLYYEGTRDPQVLASLTKLMTAVVVIEDIGTNKSIPITSDIVKTEGLAGGLTSGESYLSEDLLKLMLLTSSNDAAAAFEEYLGGKNVLARAINKKANQIGMSEQFYVEDGSGLSDFNVGYAADFLKLSKYILKNHPKIFSWTQRENIIIQPINYANQRVEYNINSLIKDRNFLGGKTGTSQAAGENLVSLFNVEDRRVLIILMDSQNRDRDVDTLINWIKKAYNFPK